MIQFSIDLSIKKRLLVICVDLTKVHIDIDINQYIQKSASFIYSKMVRIRNRKRKAFERNRKNMYTVHPFPWDCSSIGQSTALSRRKLRVRAPSVPMDPTPPKKRNLLIFCVIGNKMDKQNIISNKEGKEILNCIKKNVFLFYLVWIKDLPMLYYLILDDESI